MDIKRKRSREDGIVSDTESAWLPLCCFEKEPVKLNGSYRGRAITNVKTVLKQTN